MRLTIFNGSPRKSRSNSDKITKYFLDGFSENAGNTWKKNYLTEYKDMNKALEDYKDSESVLVVFPLYADAMPGVVKEFIESLESLLTAKTRPALGFIIHSGFPEAVHLRWLESYLDKLASRITDHYLGTIVFPGTEGFQVMPERMIKKKCRYLIDIGREFGIVGTLNRQKMQKLVRIERFKWYQLLFFKPVLKLGFADLYWKSMLKKNKTRERAGSRPLKEKTKV